MQPQCDTRTANGGRCPATATHIWKDVQFCCPHFTAFLADLFELQAAVNERQYQEIVSIYQNYSKQVGKLAKSLCDPQERDK